MGYVSWSGKSSGNWTNKADWSGGAVPGAGDDVSIDVAGVTITVSTAGDVCNTLDTDYSTLALTAGSLRVVTSATFDGNYTQSGGLLALGGEGGTFYGSVTETKGTISVAHGTLALDGSANLDSLVSGYGTLVAGTGYDETLALNAGVSLTVSHFDITSGTVTLNTSVAYAGAFSQTGGSLALNSKVLTLSGPAYLGEGALSSLGTVIASGATQLAGLSLDAASVLSITGTATVSQNCYIADQSGSTAQVRVGVAGKLIFESDNNFYSYGAGTLTNAGQVEKISGQNSSIDDSLINTGTLNVATGTLSLAGSTSILGGVVIGAGLLDFDAGTTTLSSTLSLGVSAAELDGGTLSIATAEKFAGVWDQDGYSQLSFNGAKAALTLSGAASLESGTITGAGTIALDGAAQLGDIYILDGAIVQIAQTAIQDSSDITVGETPASTADLDILAGATYSLASFTYVSGDGTITVAGTLNASSPGTTTIDPNVVVLGNVAIGSASLQFEAAVTGAGTIAIGTAGTATFDDNATIGAATTVDFAGAGGVLNIFDDEYSQQDSSFLATIAGFGSGDLIQLSDFNTTSVSLKVSGNTVTIKDASNDSLTLHFSTTQTATQLSLGIGPNGYLALIHS